MVTTIDAPTRDEVFARPWAADAGPVLVAADGRTSSAALFRLAGELADHWAADVRVLTVVEPLPLFAPPPGIEVVPPPFALEHERQAAQGEVVRQRMEAAVGDRWPVEARGGATAETIVEEAGRTHSRLLLVEQHTHSRLGRLFGADTLGRVLARTERPVLAVAPDLYGLPSRIVVGVDFSVESLRAVDAALALATPGATVTLVHVRPWLEIRHPLGDSYEARYGSQVAETLAVLMRRLPVPEGVEVRTASLVGDPVHQLTSFAERTEADLLAFGRHGYSAVERLLLGSVAAGLLGHAPCSVLVTPAPAPADAVRLRRAFLGTAESDEPAAWGALVDDFSRRNVGRRTRLQVDDAVSGAREQERGYALLGAAYDPSDRRVELMLGDAPGGRRVLTRAVEGVTSVAALATPGGGDWGLRIATGKGQTLLTLE